MPFTITTVYTGIYPESTATTDTDDTTEVVDDQQSNDVSDSEESTEETSEESSVKFAIAHLGTTRSALLYGVEVSCQNGFEANPNADIYVFNNPKAAKAFVHDLNSDFDWAAHGFRTGCSDMDTEIPGHYIVTYGRASYDSNFKKMPLGITGCRYSDHPKPFTTNTDLGFGKGKTYLTVVVVFNQGDQVTDNNAIIRGIFENA